METISRRFFLKTGATAAAVTAATPILDNAWLTLAAAETPGYFEREFGITDAACRRVLAKALAKGGDFADLYFEHTISNYLILEDGKVNQAYSAIALGVGIRTVKNDQVGYGFTQELEEKPMSDAAAIAATIADGVARIPSKNYTLLKTGNYYPLSPLFTAVPIEPKLQLVQSVNDHCFALSKLVVKVNALFHDQQKRILAFLRPESDILSAGWQVYQSKVSIGSGGFAGKKFLHGTQKLLAFLPERHSDFVYSVFSE